MRFNKNSKQKGFTIVELLVVIVVIGILAAITIVAYNGIQTRGKNAAAQSGATNLAKKIEAFNSITGAYPVFNTAGTITTQLATQAESSLTGSGLAISHTATTAANGAYTFIVHLCGATVPANGTTATGYKVYRWDYTTGAAQVTPDETGGVITLCSASTSGS